MKRYGDAWISLKRGLGLFLVLLSIGCAQTASYVRAPVRENPIPKIAKLAEQEYSVNLIDDFNLEIRDTWPFHSFLILGWASFNAHLHYSDNQLHGKFSKFLINPCNLFPDIPVY